MNILILIFVSVVMGLVPMLIYAGFLWWLDRWEKEPLHLLAAAFLWGFIPSAVIALIAQVILDTLKRLDVDYPRADAKHRRELRALRRLLVR